MTSARSTIDPAVIAGKHPIRFTGPAVDFFEGALLGNGGLGAGVTTRPDAIAIRFGHNDVWDIRVAEDNQDKIGTFQEIFERVRAIPETLSQLDEDDWYREYLAMARENYAAPYPRPLPCGSLILGFDRRRAEILGHETDIASGLCTVRMLVDGYEASVEIFTDMATDRLWLRYVASAAVESGDSPFNRIRLLPDPDTPKDFPSIRTEDDLDAGTLSFTQILPFEAPDKYDRDRGHPKDRAMRLSVRARTPLERRTRLVRHSRHVAMGPLEASPVQSIGSQPVADPEETSSGGAPDDRGGNFALCVQLDSGLATEVGKSNPEVPTPSPEDWSAAWDVSARIWRGYWSRSGVQLEDSFLERIWYWNLYFFRCAVRVGVTAPGLFANWSYRNIGTAWHGDYHLNYNTQQPFWLPFSSNHPDLHLPYVDMVERILPLSRDWARRYYNMAGAFFPHSAYPVEMHTFPYPLPHWGWEVVETPWTVQSLWWHFLYTQDREFLETRAFTPLKEATLFLVDYMTRPEAYGKDWGDDKYHVFPTVPPELYGLRPGFDKNSDCLADLTLIRFLFNAFISACSAIGVEEAEAAVLAQVRNILAHYPDYPTANTPEGPVYVSVAGEDPEIVYNVPVNTMTVFPGEEHGLDSSSEEYQLAARSYRHQRNEGGNELVFLNLVGARLGSLDLERFKRQIQYCLIPNGTCTDKALQTDGRYTDESSFDFMGRMGIWFENFALPLVVNECLLQSYSGTLRLFPNWPTGQAAEFRTLRAAGAFLVSAARDVDGVAWVEIKSEVGTTLRLVNPWDGAVRCTRRSPGAAAADTSEFEISAEILTIETAPGDVIVLERA